MGLTARRAKEEEEERDLQCNASLRKPREVERALLFLALLFALALARWLRSDGRGGRIVSWLQPKLVERRRDRRLAASPRGQRLCEAQEVLPRKAPHRVHCDEL